MVKKKYKYGVSKIIKHPQGTYKVIFNTPKKTLNNAKLLWFKNKKGKYIKNESK
jgi:hypothetical protein